MAYYTEQDPLLPQGPKAPEIIANSRPQSLKDDSYPESPAYSNVKRPQRTFGDFLTLVLGIALILGSVYILSSDNLDPGVLPRPGPVTVDQRVAKILEDTPLIDGHNDLAILVRFLYNNQIYSENFTKPFEDGGMYGHVDLPRLKAGKNGGAFWSAFVPCPKNGTDFSDENYADTVAFTLAQIDVLNRIQAAYPTVFSPPPNSSTALSYFHSGHLISPLGIEGLHQIGNLLSNLRHYYSLGVRYSTLTHNCHNKFADAALVELPGGGVEVSKPMWGGISPAGRLVIQEMNRLGMIVDLAHVSKDTMRDILGGSEDWSGSAAPIIFSHSSAYSICPHPRNVQDDILQLVKKTNSVVMVNFSPDFVSCVANPESPSGLPDFYPKNSTLEHVATHVIYIGELIGYDHVGFGSDFDGIPNTPEGLDDVSKYPDLVAELLRRGVKDEDAKKIVGGNLLRVWRDVDAIAAKLQKILKPAEDKLPKLRFGAAESGELSLGHDFTGIFKLN